MFSYSPRDDEGIILAKGVCYDAAHIYPHADKSDGDDLGDNERDDDAREAVLVDVGF